ncbi:MAG: ATP-binding cassette domain-containing protein [Aggregatilineales bacterium]
MSVSNTLLEINDLKMHFPIRKGVFQQVVGHVKAVDGVTFSIQPRETLGLVGESGCGKTTIGRCIVRDYTPTGGEILYHGAEHTVDLVSLTNKALKPYRRQIRMVFQDPFSSLNPRMTVYDILSEPLRIQKITHNRNELEDRIAVLLSQVGLRPEYMRRYPHAFSGGQRQRIGIAKALIVRPELLVADEAVSALDVSVRAQILNLMKDLQELYNLTYLFISHDLSVVKYLADRVAVMYVGRLVELAPTRPLYRKPLHPYTEALLSAVPKPNPRKRSERVRLGGDVPDPSNPPGGCYFHPRCRYVQERCKMEAPPLRRVGNEGHMVACHFAEELDLQGINPTKQATTQLQQE